MNSLLYHWWHPKPNAPDFKSDTQATFLKIGRNSKGLNTSSQHLSLNQRNLKFVNQVSFEKVKKLIPLMNTIFTDAFLMKEVHIIKFYYPTSQK